ncbi:MAG: DUF2726 domain-containing protein [Helicobacteraceae bacterium]|nr:DUF2726 domain-containing protein [Helicobacteraceae bacterium]
MIQDYLIFLKGKDKSKDIESCFLENENLKVIFKEESNNLSKSINSKDTQSVKDFDTNKTIPTSHQSPKIYTYKKENYTLIPKASNFSLFNYLKDLCPLMDIATSEGKLSFLSKEFEKLEGISKESALYAYLNHATSQKYYQNTSSLIFPFNLNKSQYIATQNALNSQISIIEGPPGTGKTQSILNIIANLIYQNKKVALLSNNNSAIENVYEKLQNYDFEYFCATLGKKENKENFIASQSGIYPDFNNKEIDCKKVENEIKTLNQKALDLFELINKKASLTQSYNELKLESKYFNAQENIKESDKIVNLKTTKLDSKTLLNAKVQLEDSPKLGIFLKLKLIFIYKIGNFRFYQKSKEEILSIFDKLYYEVRLLELEGKIKDIESKLLVLEQNKPLERLTKHSLELFRNFLAKKYKNQKQRIKFKLDDLYFNANTFLEEYPVILSTTHSIKSSLNLKNELFDYIIIDESSQVDLITGFLALSVAKNAIIVGDTKQLPNVIPNDKIKSINTLTQKYKIPQSCDFSKQSLLSSIVLSLPNAPRILLKEHYRCHPKIINFCNKKFYNDELIILSKDSGEDDVLEAFITQSGNHSRGHYNQRQIDVIEKEILPHLELDSKDIGIISPYNLQKEKLSSIIKNIQIDTIHKYQGREKDAIILSSVDNEINDFINDKNLLNVAVSRAKKYLRVVVSREICQSDNNLNDLVKYIGYQNEYSIKQSKVKSIFDLLYKANYQARLKYLKNKKRISKYDSENIAYNEIKKLLKEYSNLDLVTHIPLYRILSETSLLNESEIAFVNSSSHIDIVIFNKMDKSLVLCIEIDGFAFHIKQRQKERDRLKDSICKKYEIPLLRLNTTQSEEIRRIREILG